jgi:hypothetical protein
MDGFKDNEFPRASYFEDAYAVTELCTSSGELSLLQPPERRIFAPWEVPKKSSPLVQATLE